MPSQIREAQKQETRARVVEAARAEFAEVGYANATLRAIARRADVSTGAIFASFRSKEELLAEVQLGVIDQIGDAMLAIPIDGLDLASALKARIGAAIRYEARDIDNALARIAASYSWTPDYEATYLGAIRKPISGVAEAISAAMARGEASPDTDVETAIDTLFTVYLRILRRGRIYGEDADALCARMDRTIDLVVAALKPAG